MRKIRVLHVINSINGGAGSILLRYCNELKEDCEFDFAIDSPADFEWLDTNVNNNGWGLYYFPKMHNGYIKYVKGIRDILKEKEYDVIYSHVGYCSFIPMFLGKRYNVKYRIAHSHTSNMKSGLVKQYIRKMRGVITSLYATNLYACGINSAIWTWGERNYFKGRVTIVRNALNITEYSYSEEKRKEFRKQLGISDGVYACVSVARMSEEKNQLFLLDVWEEVIRNNSNIQLFLVGNGPLEGKVIQEIHDRNLENYVYVLGARNDIPLLLNGFDCFLLPSKFEGVPLTLVEAQANGMIVYASRNVPTEVGITDLVTFVDLNIYDWANCIGKKTISERRDSYSRLVSEAGYNIMTESEIIKDKIKTIFKGEDLT